MRHTPFVAALIGLALTPSLTAQNLVGDGFEITGNLPVPVFSQFAYRADGSYFQYSSDFATGQHFELHAPDGTLLADLGGPGVDTFPSFAILDPTETFALVGESGTGDIMTVDLAGGGFSVVANLAFNYAAAFTPDGSQVYVSAASGAAGNDITRLDVGAWLPVTTATVSGFSGPVAIDAAGDLYYGTTGSAEVLRWTKAQLDSGILLGETDATVFASGFSGILAMDFDPLSGHLFLTDNNFNPSIDDKVVELDGQGAVADIVVEGEFGVTLGGLDLVAGGGRATFHAYQPTNVALHYDNTDFNSFTTGRLTIEPKRATMTIAGPPSGPGAMTLTITDAKPNSAVLILWGSQFDYVPVELQFDIGWGAPFHSALPLGSIRRGQFNTPTDSQGTAVFQYWDAGLLHGTLVFQALVLEPTTAPIGSSTAVLN